MSLVYVFAGVLLALISWLSSRLAYLHLRGTRTGAIITGIEENDSGEGITYRPVVTFVTATGVSVTATSQLGTEQAQAYYRVGSRVEVIYSPTNPQLFIIRGYDIASLVLVLLIGVIFLFLFIYSATGVNN